MGWTNSGNGILFVQDEDRDKLNILKSYGILSIINVTQAAEITVRGETQKALDSFLLYHCLLNSLSGHAKTKVALDEEEFTILYNVGHYIHYSGLLLLCCILTLA